MEPIPEPAEPITSGPTGISSTPGITPLARILIGILLLLVVALPFSRSFLHRSVPPPPPNADEATLFRYYSARLRDRPSDKEALVHLALLDEKRGYYMAAIDRLHAARRGGASERETAGPMGRCLMHLNRLDEALPEIEKAAKIDPDSVEAAIDLASLQYLLGEPANADQTLRGFCDRQAGFFDSPDLKQRVPLERVARSFLSLGDYAYALKGGQLLIRIEPGDAAGYGIAGRALYEQGKWTEAADNLRIAARMQLDEPEYAYLSGNALQKLGRYDDAMAQWKAVLRANERYSDAYLKIGDELARRADWLHASNAYMAAGAQGGDPARAYSLAASAWQRLGKTTQVLYCRAVVDTVRGNYEAALRVYAQLAQDKDLTWKKRGLDSMAETYRLMGRNKEFLEAAKKAAFSQLADDYLRLANAALLLNMHAEREQYLKKALELSPALAGPVHRELGANAERSQNRDEAERQYEEAAAAQPQNASYQRILAHVYFDRRTTGDRLKKALQAAERAVMLAPDDPETVHQAGVVYQFAGDQVKAKMAFQHVIDLQPGNASAYLDLGQALRKMGDAKGSEEMLVLYRTPYAQGVEKLNLTEKTRSNPKDALAQAALGDFYMKNHSYLQAASQFERALRLAPADAALREKLGSAKRAIGLVESNRPATQVTRKSTGQ